MKKRLGLKYSTMNNHYVKGQRVPSKLYKENYDQIKWAGKPIKPEDFNGLQAVGPGGKVSISNGKY